MSASPAYGERPPMQGSFRRSFTTPTRSLSFHEKAGLDKADADADVLYTHPAVRIISFSPPTDSIKSTSKAEIPPDTDYPVDTVETLPWRSRTETLAAAGQFMIEKVRGSTNFLKCQSVMHAILRNSQCWCVDGESKFVLRVRQFKYYRIELPSTTDDDKAKVEELKNVLPKVLRYERTPCPFIRAFTVDLPEDAITPRRKGQWKRRDSSQPNTPSTESPPLRRAKRSWSTKTPPTSYPNNGPGHGVDGGRGRPDSTGGSYRRGSLVEQYRNSSPASFGHSEDGTDSEPHGSEHDSELESTTDRSETASPRKHVDGLVVPKRDRMVVTNVDGSDQTGPQDLSKSEESIASTADSQDTTSQSEDESRGLPDQEFDRSVEKDKVVEERASTQDTSAGGASQKPEARVVHDIEMSDPDLKPDLLPVPVKNYAVQEAASSTIGDSLIAEETQERSGNVPVSKGHESISVPGQSINDSVESLSAENLSTDRSGESDLDAEAQSLAKADTNDSSSSMSPSDDLESESASASEEHLPEVEGLQPRTGTLNTPPPMALSGGDHIHNNETRSGEPAQTIPQGGVELRPQVLREQQSASEHNGDVSGTSETGSSEATSEEESSSEEASDDSEAEQHPLAATQAGNISLNTQSLDEIDHDRENREFDALSPVSSVDSFHTIASPTKRHSLSEGSDVDFTPTTRLQGPFSPVISTHKRGISEITVTASTSSTPASPEQQRSSTHEVEENQDFVPRSVADISHNESVTSSADSPEENVLRQRLKARRSFSPMPPASTIFVGQIRHDSGRGHMTKAILQKMIVKPIEAVILVVHVLARIAGGATVSDLMSGELFKRPENQRSISGFADQLHRGKGGSDTEDDYGNPTRGRRRSTERRVAVALDEDDDDTENVD